MKLTGTIMLLFLVLTIFSCEKEDIVKDGSNETKILGTWSWQNSVGGFTGNLNYTPQSTGIDRKWIFLKNDTVIVTENGDTTFKVNYFLSREKSNLFKDTFNFVTINYTFPITNPDTTLIVSMRYIIRTLNDTLNVQEDVYDGYTHQYLKADR
jgi:hypothetical protein